MSSQSDPVCRVRAPRRDSAFADVTAGVSMPKPILFLSAASAARGLALASVAALGLASAPHAFAQGAVKGKFGDWEMRCETPPGASREQCAIIQSVAAEDKPNINLV